MSRKEPDCVESRERESNGNKSGGIHCHQITKQYNTIDSVKVKCQGQNGKLKKKTQFLGYSS